MTAGDPIGLALASIGAGATAGGSVIGAGLVVFRMVQAEPAASEDAQFFVITAGLMAGLVTAVTTAALLTRSIPDLWRRGVAGAIAAFSAALLGGLAAPVDAVGGLPGLAVYVFLLVIGSARLTAGARAAGQS